MAKYQVSDKGDIKAHFTMIPNIIDDMGLSVYAYRLYGHLKRVAGEAGECWQTTRTLADACKMSAMSVTRAKRELLENNLISLREETGSTGWKYHVIAIEDIWRTNTDKFRTLKPVPASYSTDEHTVPDGYSTVPVGYGTVPDVVLKNNPLRITLEEKQKINGAKAPTQPEPKPKAKKVADERLQHPAIIAYRSVAKYTPPEVSRDAIIRAVGDNLSQVDRWTEHIKSWIMRGYNIRNLAGIIDTFNSGGLQSTPSARDKPLSRQDQINRRNNDYFDSELRKAEHGNGRADIIDLETAG